MNLVLPIFRAGSWNEGGLATFFGGGGSLPSGFSHNLLTLISGGCSYFRKFTVVLFPWYPASNYTNFSFERSCFTARAARAKNEGPVINIRDGSWKNIMVFLGKAYWQNTTSVVRNDDVISGIKAMVHRTGLL